MVFGSRRSPVSLAAEDDAPASTPWQVLERLLVPALTRTPCLVAFSGGRDSSAVLAAATRVAREHGLDDPVPVTLRYQDHPRTWEDEWQETTIRHLELAEWHKLAISTELDAVGPVAGPLLERHGLFWPPNAHAMTPLLRQTRGGTLVTGNGGDEVFTPWALRRVSLIRRGRLLPGRHDVVYVGLSLLPERLRVALWRLRRQPRLRWLSPEGLRRVQALWAVRSASFDRSWASALEGLLASRYLELALSVFEAQAHDARAALAHPFLEPAFVRAIGRTTPREGPTSRAAALRRLVGDLLPEVVLTRPTKASFTEVLCGPESRTFASSWDGSGLDARLIDVEALKREWATPRPDFRSITALQAAWLAQTG
jgi:hypothetical protein